MIIIQTDNLTIEIENVQVKLDKQEFPAGPLGRLYEGLRVQWIVWNPGNAESGVRPGGVMQIDGEITVRMFEHPGILAPYHRAWARALRSKAAQVTDDQSKVA